MSTVYHSSVTLPAVLCGTVGNLEDRLFHGRAYTSNSIPPTAEHLGSPGLPSKNMELINVIFREILVFDSCKISFNPNSKEMKPHLSSVVATFLAYLKGHWFDPR